MEFIYFLGRFHPLLLHLPIGILVLAFVMELVARRPRFFSLSAAVPFTLGLGAITAVFTALLGYFLSLEGGYSGGSLEVHKYAGLALALLSVLLYGLRARGAGGKAYMPLFLLTMAMLVVTGHYGGNITHGSDYLTEYAPSPVRQALGLPIKIDFSTIDLAALDSLPAYVAITQPILDDKCVSCHNPDKMKGELRLDEAEHLFRGGETGPAIEPGKASESLLIERIHLPMADDLHMPPDGKEQLEEDEKMLLEWWIDAGAELNQPVGLMDKPEAIQEALKRRFEPEGPQGVFALDIAPLSENTRQNLLDNGLDLRPIAQASPLLELNLANAREISLEQIQQLTKADRQLVHVNLSNTPANDRMLEVLGRLPHLTHLHLDRTDITDEGLRALEGLAYLEYLNLYHTAITDEGLRSLAKVPALRKVFLWQTQTTEAGIAQLREALPEADIDTGIDLAEVAPTGMLPPPGIQSDHKWFEGSTEVTLSGPGQAEIRYTLDGSQPDSNSMRYSEPLRIDQHATLAARAFSADRPPSPVAKEQFIRLRFRPSGASLQPAPNAKYAGQGEASLYDLQCGSKDFRADSRWLGWEAVSPIATFDLGAARKVSKVWISSLEDSEAWIFFPKGLRVEVSGDGQTFQEVAIGSFQTLSEPAPPQTRLFSLTFPPQTARYVRVQVESRRENPRWHTNPGEPCWVFVDEILID